MWKRGRVGSLVVVACSVVSGCGGPAAERDASSASPLNSEVAATVAATSAPATAPATADAPESVAVADDAAGTPAVEQAVRRELGLVLRPESDVSTNLLPPVEVHDVGQDRMVNFKNIFPAERPVLLWMWAPY